MRFLRFGPWYLAAATGFIAFCIYLIYKVFYPSTLEFVTATIERGSVSELVSVSGFVEAEQIADLAFPSTGVVTDVLVEEGSKVEAGAILATLAATQLVAERAEAVSSLTAARANYDKTVAGPRTETVTLANTNLTNAKEKLDQVTTEEDRKVENAHTALLSTGLTAVSAQIDESSTPPAISGTYNCNTEGSYSIKVYSSASESGYSYNYSGLEKGTGTASTDQPAPLGTCGLYLIFTAGDKYTNSEWLIEIPNTRSSSYTSLNNTYQLTLTQAENAIKVAKNTLALVTDEASLSTAPARHEEVTEVSATVSQAQARIAAIDAKISDRSIVAPFSGTVTEVNITKGESAPASAVITLLADNTFSLKARIPEIDITKIALNQTVHAVFDAQNKEIINGKVVFISPIAKQIDGVAYFETTIELDQKPDWLRAGLNADIDIVVQNKDGVLRVPKRFVLTLADGSRAVLLRQGNKTATTSVEIIFTGNDSFLEIAGLPEGTEVIAP